MGLLPIAASRYLIALIGRGGEIRTHDPLRPRQVRYQAALRPDYTDCSSARPSCYPDTQVLVEERGPPVTRRVIPWIRSAGRKGQPRRNRRAGSVARRLVNTANTCSLSFDLVLPGRMERYREVVTAPPGCLFDEAARLLKSPNWLWTRFS